MPIIRRRLNPADVYPNDIRYNPAGDKVERLIDGEWKESPQSDPRRNNTLPPRITADTRCDAAQSVSDAMKNQIDQILTAIDNAQTLATIAGLILGLFSFGVFAIFINIALAIADYMLGLGTTAINASLTPTAWDTFTCILYCYMDDDGRIQDADLTNIYQDLTDQIGLPGSQVLIEFLSLAGHGGINNLAAVGSSTGDCDECGCPTDWCKFFPFGTDEEWQAIALGTGGIFGTLSGGEWVGTDAIDTISSPDLAHTGIVISRFFASRTVTRIEVTFDLTKGTIDQTAGSAFRIAAGDVFTGTVLVNRTYASLSNGTDQTIVWEGSQDMENLQVYLFSSRDQSSPYSYGGTTHIKSIRMEGEGGNPFGADDCP